MSNSKMTRRKAIAASTAAGVLAASGASASGEANSTQRQQAGVRIDQMEFIFGPNNFLRVDVSRKNRVTGRQDFSVEQANMMMEMWQNGWPAFEEGQFIRFGPMARSE